MRHWLIGLSAAGFLCGAICAWAGPLVLRRFTEVRKDAYTETLARFRHAYRLTDAQERSIRLVLTQRDREILLAYSGHHESLPKALREEVEGVRRKADQRIEWGVLDSRQREQYRKDRAPGEGDQERDR